MFTSAAVALAPNRYSRVHRQKVIRYIVSFLERQQMLIAEAMGVVYELAFVLPDGEKISIGHRRG